MQRSLILSLNVAVLALIQTPISQADQQKLDTIVITNRHLGAKPILRDEIIATENVSSREIEKSGATTLTEALDKRAGISLQNECSVCNARNIVLNNLPGRYTTLMIDGIPIFSSVSSAYGLDSVNLGGIERIEISRGAGASLIAPEALSGMINIVSRRPLTDELKAVQQIGSYHQQQTDLFAAHTFSSGAVTANFQHQRHNALDNDQNGISEYSGYRRELGGIGFFLDDLGTFKVRGRLDFAHEKRHGGALSSDYEGTRLDLTGNPFNWSAGPHGSPDPQGWVTPNGSGPNILANGQPGIFYNNGRAGMSEFIFTDRQQLVTSATRKLATGTLKLALGYAHHTQDSFYENSLYRADQKQQYFEISTQQLSDPLLWTVGFNYRSENLQSHGETATGIPNDGIDDYRYHTPGLFLQAYRSFLDNQLELNSSLRLDQHNVFGSIISPRLNLLWNHNEHLNSRIALGKGFRAPTSFFEQEHGILDTTRIERQINKPEISHNASYTISYASDRLGWVGNLHWNRIQNMAIIDPNQTDSSGEAITLFTSATQPVKIFGGDFTLTYKITPALEGTFGLEKTRYDFTPGSLSIARPNERVYLGLDYAKGPWDFVVRATWTGQQNLAQFYDYANNPRYNLDGTAKMDKSPSFWTMDLRGEYRINTQWSAFIGVDNTLNWRQTDHESFLWVDQAGNYDTTQFWGPNRGRFIYGGIKFTL